MIDSIVDKAIAKSVSGYISESTLFQIVDDNNMDDMAFSILCEKLALQGITIVDDSEFNSLIDVTDKEKNNLEEVQEEHKKLQKVLDAFSELSQYQMEQCLKILTDRYFNLISNDNVHESDKRLKTENDLEASVLNGCIQKQSNHIESRDVKTRFIANISARPLQYSYVAICLKSFLKCSNNNGIASLSDMAEYFDEFYSNRRNNGNVVEQQDSIIYKGYTLSKLEQLIKHNPLSRSYLNRYLFVKKENKTEFVYMKHELWFSLSEKDKQDIEDVLDRLLADYYNKILLT